MGEGGAVDVKGCERREGRREGVSVRGCEGGVRGCMLGEGGAVTVKGCERRGYERRGEKGGGSV